MSARWSQRRDGPDDRRAEKSKDPRRLTPRVLVWLWFRDPSRVPCREECENYPRMVRKQSEQ